MLGLLSEVSITGSCPNVTLLGSYPGYVGDHLRLLCPGQGGPADVWLVPDVIVKLFDEVSSYCIDDLKGCYTYEDTGSAAGGGTENLMSAMEGGAFFGLPLLGLEASAVRESGCDNLTSFKCLTS